VLYSERIDSQTEQMPFLAFVEKAAARPEFLPHTVVPVYSLMYLRRRIDWQTDTFAQRPHGTDMIRVVVCDENTHNILEIKVHLPQTLLYLTRRDARVNEYSPLTRAKIVAVSTAAAGETPEYKSVLIHFTKPTAKVQKKLHICKKNDKKLAYITKNMYLCTQIGFYL
jgi:hypothetical protein